MLVVRPLTRRGFCRGVVGWLPAVVILRKANGEYLHTALEKISHHQLRLGMVPDGCCVG